MARLIEWVRFVPDHVWARRHMSEYLDGDLDPAGRRRIERHVHSCPKCEALLGVLRRMTEALGGLGRRSGRSVAPAVLTGVRERLEADEGDDRAL